VVQAEAREFLLVARTNPQKAKTPRRWGQPEIVAFERKGQCEEKFLPRTGPFDSIRLVRLES
jgi:hypothetical protein